MFFDIKGINSKSLHFGLSKIKIIFAIDRLPKKEIISSVSSVSQLFHILLLFNTLTSAVIGILRLLRL